MSASREKKKRQEFLANGGVDPKAVRAAEQQAAEKKAKILYTSLAVVFVVVTAALLVFNSGILQRSKTALTIDGEKYNVADVAFYYTNTYQNLVQSLGGETYAAMFGLDTTKSLKEQTTTWGNSSEEQTWHDYILEQSIDALKLIHVATKKAEAEGLTLDEADLANFDSTVAAAKNIATSAGMSYKAYLSAAYGSVMTPSIYEDLLKDNLLADKYVTTYQESLTFTEDEIVAEYEANKNTYDVVDGAYFYISGAPEAKTDAEGKTVAATEEEIAAAMAEAKKQAEKILAAYKDGQSLETLSIENNGTYTGDTKMSYNSSVAGTWLFDESRKAGDSAVLEDTTNNRYYIAAFNGRQRNNTPNYNVRHILVTADNLDLADGETATNEQILAKAEEILASWDKTEAGFATLANEYSQDTGSNTNGGLYEDVTEGYMVTEFNDWCYAEGRTAGDTGIVETTHGQHIMYFVGYGDTEYWHSACESQLRSDTYSAWETEVTESVTVERLSGLDSVG